MMEEYGKSTSEEDVKEVTSTATWEKKLAVKVKTADWYDRETEWCADYCPKDIVCPEQVWRVFADIEKVTIQNAVYIAYAWNMMDGLR